MSRCLPAHNNYLEEAKGKYLKAPQGGKKFPTIWHSAKDTGLLVSRKTESMTTILKNYFRSPMLLEKKKKKEQRKIKMTLKKKHFSFLYLNSLAETNLRPQMFNDSRM